MKPSRILVTLVIVSSLIIAVLGATSAGVFAQANDSGPTTVVGQVGSANAIVAPNLFPEPSVALVDASNLIARKYDKFVPDSAQILGTLTTPLFPLPGKFSINLPIVPTAAYVDLDNNGAADKGVQVFYMLVSSNIIGNSYLQQLEQASGLGSYIQDTASGEITQGSFLVYAPDNGQSFPSAIGADGKWFTADDPTAPLEQGYTVATLGADGKATFDRSNPATINSIEPAEVASADFSNQGILESFNSLIDRLKKRYAYTELRKLDWEKIRADNLPAVQAADANKDFVAYYAVLDEIALSLRDAHVSASTNNIDARVGNLKKKLEGAQANLGAAVIAVTDANNPQLSPDSKIIVRDVSDNTPAKQAGWVPGTEIVSIDGKSTAARFDEIPLLASVGTQDALIFQKSARLLSFPLSQTVTIGYRLPDASEVMTATMTAGEYPTALPTPLQGFEPPISFTKNGDFVVIRWTDFSANVLPKIQTLEMALAFASDAPGVILDLRGNGGGWLELMDTMASYFFTADKPFARNLTDFYYYDDAAGKLVRVHAVDHKLSAPNPEVAYTGPLIILVDSSCASACEYFSQHMQQVGRAQVIGQYTTEGAGGPIDRIKLPGATTFQYTVGKTTFAGKDELNLEAKGVTLDVRVPVTLETELAKQNGGDPVMDAAIAELTKSSDPSARLSANPWQWSALLDANGKPQTIEAPDKYTVTFGADGSVNVTADCNKASGTYTVNADSQMTITLGPATLAECAAGSQSAEFLNYLAAARGYEFEGNTIAILLSSDSGALEIVLQQAK